MGGRFSVGFVGLVSSKRRFGFNEELCTVTIYILDEQAG